MDKIMVGFDGSDRARDALHLAKAIATVERAELILAFVYEPDSIFDGGDVYMPGPGGKRAKGRREAAVARIMAEAERGLEGMTFSYRDGWGSPPHVLDALAAAADVDLLVLGSTHRGEIGRVLPGSVAQRLLNGAPCAVAVAPSGYAGHTPFGAGTIGVGCDGSAESLLALDQASELASELSSRLRLIAAYPPYFPGEYQPGAIATTDYMRLMLKDAEARLADAESRVHGVDDVVQVAIEGDPATVLEQQGADLDLLVVGSRGYGPLRSVLLGSVTSRLMSRAVCPVLITPHGVERESGPVERVPFVAMI